MIHQTAISYSIPSLYNSSFVRAMIEQVRMQDLTVSRHAVSDEVLLNTLVGYATLDRDSDISSLQKVSAFYRAVASRLEQETGQMAEVFLNLDQDNVGWILVFCGRLLVISQFIRDPENFQFESAEHLTIEGERVLKNALERAREYFDFPVQHGLSVA
ncbi:MAG: DUF269 domain-containing protein [Cyanobacteriota bacterium]|nr:DUF269 domain-containing protein [Cyanobacteriota bacterium]